ncbi:helix-turn-helix domain-containing protein [Infirmifilum sp. NZ]|uniref:helix-turn-helix domain-containing protein n=1 Tax=Infirmifilum sp. NZ TaxID=2926850 RepID=UPI00279B1744|nr:helix-turn-helix domain-containing protein [Infirmifilum sp. NZ]UNQ72835.1 helix-turn-helix domain-containing protein [Infirmifilum sp. NZ]
MSEIPLKPVGKEDVRRLELSLILGTLLRPEVIDAIRNAEDKLTWLDSLVVAAGALARERAGYSIVKIAEELGRTEATIRNHLAAKTEAGKLVKETYEKLLQSGGKLDIPILGTASQSQVEELRKRVEELERKLENVRKALEEILRSI